MARTTSVTSTVQNIKLFLKVPWLLRINHIGNCCKSVTFAIEKLTVDDFEAGSAFAIAIGVPRHLHHAGRAQAECSLGGWEKKKQTRSLISVLVSNMHTYFYLLLPTLPSEQYRSSHTLQFSTHDQIHLPAVVLKVVHQLVLRGQPWTSGRSTKQNTPKASNATAVEPHTARRRKSGGKELGKITKMMLKIFFSQK